MAVFHACPESGRLQECATDDDCGLDHYVLAPRRKATKVEQDRAQYVWAAFHRGLRLLHLSDEKLAWHLRNLIGSRLGYGADWHLLKAMTEAGRGHELYYEGGSERLERLIGHERAALRVAARRRYEGQDMAHHGGIVEALTELVAAEAEAHPHLLTIMERFAKNARERG